MSYVQHAGIKGNVLVVSTCGNPSAQALDLLARKASEFKSAKFEIARDADKGGEAWTGAIKAAIHLGAPDAKVAVRLQRIATKTGTTRSGTSAAPTRFLATRHGSRKPHLLPLHPQTTKGQSRSRPSGTFQSSDRLCGLLSSEKGGEGTILWGAAALVASLSPCDSTNLAMPC